MCHKHGTMHPQSATIRCLMNDAGTTWNYFPTVCPSANCGFSLLRKCVQTITTYLNKFVHFQIWTFLTLSTEATRFLQHMYSFLRNDKLKLTTAMQ